MYGVLQFTFHPYDCDYDVNVVGWRPTYNEGLQLLSTWTYDVGKATPIRIQKAPLTNCREVKTVESIVVYGDSGNIIGKRKVGVCDSGLIWDYYEDFDHYFGIALFDDCEEV